MINNLTFDARSIQGDAADVKIVISLAGTDYLRPEFIAGARGAIVQNLPLELVTGADGTVVTPLVATTDYVNATQYVARIGNGKPITFTMPDNDANFYEITQQAGVPPSPASLPVGLQDGDVIVGQDGEYALKKQIWVHPNPPTNPATNAIWWDSSTTPAEPRYTSDAGASWQAILSAEDLAARINSLTGGSRVQGEHIEGLPDIPIVATAPTSTEGYRPSNLLLVQPAGVTDRLTLYGVSGEVDAAVTNRNRLQFVIANNAIQSNPAPTDNYRDFLGSINYNQGTRSSVLTIRLDTGLFGAEIPDQLWITGLESSGAAEFRADIARPTIRANGRTYKQLNYVVSDALRASGINGAQTWLLFSDVGASQAFDFKPAIEHNPSEWVELTGGSGGGGLSQGQVDARIRAGVEDWAEEGNTDAIPAGKLTNAPSGISQADATNLIAAWARASGASGQAPSSVLASDTPSQHQVLIATSATGREWDLIDGSNIANAGIEEDNIPDGEITGAKMAQDTIQQSNLHPNLERQLLPGGGNANQLLAKSSGSPYDTGWVNAPTSLPSGGSSNQVLTKQSATDGDADWENLPNDLPTGGTDGQVLTKSSGTNYDVGWETPTTGGGGLTQTQVDARIAQFARAGNTDLIPRAKLASGGSVGQVLKRTATGQEWANDEGLTQTQVDARVQAGVADWAETGNNDEVPVGKVASGGLTGQALVRTATGKRWQTISTGAGTPLSVTAVESDFSPALASTDFSGLTEHQINITAGTLDSNHPFSVSSNGIVVASNTNPFLAELGVRFDIDPTAWTNSANAGGNRMFLQAYWKKDGTIIESTRRDYYIRGDERYAPTTHILPYNTTEILSPGTYTLWLIKVGLAAAGNEINSISLASTSSINIRSEEYSGGNVEAGLNEAAVDARVSAGVLDWAETGDTDTIPSTKLASGGSVGQVLKRTATGQEWGADAGGLSQAQVDARVAVRVPDGGSTGQVLKKSSATDGDTEWANDVGLTQSQVDARVQAGVANFAEEGNTDLVPQGKLASGGSVGQVLKRTASGQEWANDNEGLNQSQVDARVTAGVADFAEQGNTDLIPQGKLASGGSTGQVLKRTSSSQEWANDEGLTQTQVDGRVTALVENFAEVANASTAVPTSKGGVPSGGSDNQVLTKTSGSDYAVAWETPASAGLSQADVDARIAQFARAGNTDLVPQAKLASGGSVGQVLTRTATGQEWAASTSGRNVPLSVTPIESSFTPSLPATSITAIGETQINIAAGTIDSSHPLSVSSNGIVVAAGTSPFQATLDVVVEIDPTGYTSSTTSGGNRLFFDIYLKKDGVIMPASRTSQYMRAHEGWGALTHKAHLTFTDMLEPGTYTLWFYRSVAAGAGNEVNALQINAANSTLVINSESYAGGGGDVPIGGSAGQVLTWPQTGSTPIWAAASGGLDQASVDARIAAFARAGNTDLIPRAKLASGGSVGDVLKRTATGQEWSGDIGLNQTEVDGRVTALVADFAEQGNSALLPDGKLSTTTRNRLMPGGGADNQVLTKTSGSDYAVAWETPASPGLNQAAVDARVQAGVKDYAEQGNTTNKIPLDDLATAVAQRLLPAGGADDAVLTKTSASDYAVAWEAPSAGGSLTYVNELQAKVAYDRGSSTVLNVLSEYQNYDELVVVAQLGNGNTNVAESSAVPAVFRIPIAMLPSSPIPATLPAPTIYAQDVTIHGTAPFTIELIMARRGSDSLRFSLTGRRNRSAGGTLQPRMLYAALISYSGVS